MRGLCRNQRVGAANGLKRKRRHDRCLRHRHRYRHRQDPGEHGVAACIACAGPARGRHEAGGQRLRRTTADGWRNEDALALQAASDPRPDYADLNPYALPLPLAPEFAAREAGIEVALDPILAAHARLAAHADAVVVEGVGGWVAPLSATLDQADLVRALQLPVVLVVGLRLGCLNHARLSARAIAADGCATGRLDRQRDRSRHGVSRREFRDACGSACPRRAWGVCHGARDPIRRSLSQCLQVATIMSRLTTTSGTFAGKSRMLH